MKRGQQRAGRSLPLIDFSNFGKELNKMNLEDYVGYCEGERNDLEDGLFVKGLGLPLQVVREVRGLEGEVLGYVHAAYDGSPEGAARVARGLGHEIDDRFGMVWSNVASRIGATDWQGHLCWVVSPNFAHVAEHGTREAAYIWGDLSAAEGERDENGYTAVERRAGFYRCGACGESPRVRLLHAQTEGNTRARGRRGSATCGR